MRWANAEELWHKWDAAIEEGAKPEEVIPQVSVESMSEMLACADPGERRYELDFLATELVNRLTRTERMLDVVTRAAVKAIEDLAMKIETAVPAVHDAEGRLRDASVTGDVAESATSYKVAARASVSIEAIRSAVEDAREAEEKLLHLHDYRKGIARGEGELEDFA